MPVYEYVCDNCGTVWEVDKPDAGMFCPECPDVPTRLRRLEESE